MTLLANKLVVKRRVGNRPANKPHQGEPCKPGWSAASTGCKPHGGVASPSTDAPTAKPEAAKPTNNLASHVAAGKENVHAGNLLSSVLRSPLKLFEAVKKTKAAIGQKIFDASPKKVQVAMTKVAAIAGAVEHQLNRPYKAAQAYAKAVAQERGLSDKHVDRVAKVLSLADGIGKWTTNVPALHTGIHALELLGGPASFVAAKIGYYVPVASLGYLGYSLTAGAALSGKNPFKLIAGARQRVRAAAAQSKEKEHKRLGWTVTKGEGTCGVGERADLTGCTPVNGQATTQKPTNNLPNQSMAKPSQHQVSEQLDWAERFGRLVYEPKLKLVSIDSIRGIGAGGEWKVGKISQHLGIGGAVPPIYVNFEGNIQDGEHRYQAAKKAGLDSVWVLQESKPKEEQHGQKRIHGGAVEKVRRGAGPGRIRKSPGGGPGPGADGSRTRLRGGFGTGGQVPGPAHHKGGYGPRNRLKGLVAKCQQGPNAGKPGPCPNPAGAAAPATDKPAATGSGASSKVDTPKAGGDENALVAVKAKDVFQRIGAAETWGEQHYGQWSTSLPSELRKEILAYKQDSLPVNNYLRQGDGGWRQLEKVERLDKAIRMASRTPHAIRAYRAGDLEFYGSLEEGEEFTDNGFVSTSVNIAGAGMYRDPNVGLNRRGAITILIPKGARGAYFSAVDNGDMADEFVLARGSRFRVVRKNKGSLVVKLIGRKKE